MNDLQYPLSPYQIERIIAAARQARSEGLHLLISAAFRWMVDRARRLCFSLDAVVGGEAERQSASSQTGWHNTRGHA